MQAANGEQNGFHPTEETEEPQAQAVTPTPEPTGPAMTHAVAELLGTLRQAAPAIATRNGANGNIKKPVSIQWRKDTLYRDGLNDLAVTNKLSLADVDYLQYALQQAPGHRIGGPGQNININVSGQPIFRAEQGIVTVNALPNRSLEQTTLGQADHPPLAQGPFYGGPGMATMPPVIVQAPMTVERSRDKTPSFLERLDVASELGQTSTSHERWMKMPLSQRFKQKVENLFTFIRKNRAADTAIDLLQQQGQRQGGEYVYDAEKYRLRGVGRMVLVEDRQGRGLMTIQTKLFGRPRIKGYGLTPEQQSDFLQVRSQRQQLGAEGFSKDPIIRSNQMGGLAPQGDARIGADLKAFSVSDVARDLINASGSQPDPAGKRVLDGQQYRVEEGPNRLVIFAKGRGQIFSQADGKIDSKLTAQDTKHFIFVSKELAALQKQRQTLQRPQSASRPAAGISV